MLSKGVRGACGVFFEESMTRSGAAMLLERDSSVCVGGRGVGGPGGRGVH